MNIPLVRRKSSSEEVDRFLSSSATRVFTVLLAFSGGILFGYGTGVIAGALPLVKQSYDLGSWAQGWIVSIALLGAALTAPISGRLADRFGRRLVIGYAAIIYMAGTVISACSISTVFLMGGRFLVGLSLGATSFAVPLYISEISPPLRRGAMVTINQLAITVGLLLSYISAYLFASSHAWRWMIGLCLVPSVFVLLCTVLVPESPEWLTSRGDMNRAFRSARRLDIPTTADYSALDSSSSSRKINLRDAFGEAGFLKVMLGLGMAILVQFTGLNTAIYYAPTILASIGMTSSAGVIGSILVGACNMMATVVTIVLLDRVGRRPLMIVGLLVMAICAAGIAVNQFLGSSGIVVALLLCVFITAGAIGPAAVFWVYIGEIYPARGRATLMSVATATLWGADFTVATTFLPLVQGISLGGAFTTYAVISVAGALLLARYMSETRGKPLGYVAGPGDYDRISTPSAKKQS